MILITTVGLMIYVTMNDIDMNFWRYAEQRWTFDLNIP